MTYKKMVYLTKQEENFINKLLTTEPTCREECFDEDTPPIVHTARFSDGMEMDIKLCGVQYHEEEESNLPWTEAVLFDNGAEVNCTEVEDTYFGEWWLNQNGNTYIAVVKAVA